MPWILVSFNNQGDKTLFKPSCKNKLRIYESRSHSFWLIPCRGLSHRSQSQWLLPFRCQAAPFQCHTSQAKGCWYPGTMGHETLEQGLQLWETIQFNIHLLLHMYKYHCIIYVYTYIPVLTRRRSRTFRASTMGFAKGMATSNESHLGGWVRCERMGCKEDDCCICAG